MNVSPYVLDSLPPEVRQAICKVVDERDRLRRAVEAAVKGCLECRGGVTWLVDDKGLHYRGVCPACRGLRTALERT